MLGHGPFHTRVPRDPAENLAYRRRLLEACKHDARLRASVTECCRQDILFFINSFVWQYNPKKKGLRAVEPFVTWDYQEAGYLDRPETTGRRGFLWCYENNRSVVCEKSREMGATWWVLIGQDWLSLFHPYTQSLNISRSADAVDCKSPDSLFWKIRFMHQHLPEWLRGPIDEGKFHFGYKRTNAVISGEASTGRAGVGGRASLIFADEVSKIREAAEVRQRTANTSDFRVFVSTHEGTGTEFYRMTQTPEFVKLVWHWTQHPEKRRGLYRFDKESNRVEILDREYSYPPGFEFVRSEYPLGGPAPGLRSPWYDAKCVEIGNARAIAIELDIDVAASVEQFFNVALVNQLIGEHCREPDWIGGIEVDHQFGKSLGLVELNNGHLKLWVRPNLKGGFRPSRYVAGADIAAGTGATPSCLTVADRESGVKVAEYTNAFLPPEKFAAVCAAIGRLFADKDGRPAYFAWEAAGGVGQQFGKTFMGLGYGNIYYRDLPMTFGGLVKKSDQPGWYPHGENKKNLLLSYAARLNNRHFVNTSESAMRECLQFRWTAAGGVDHATEANSSDPSGAGLNHADHVIADALAAMLLGDKPVTALAPERNPDPPVLSWDWRHKIGEENDAEYDPDWG